MTVTVAALQLHLNLEAEADNIAAVSALVEEAAQQGAQIVLPPELFSGGYFCRETISIILPSSSSGISAFARA